MIQRIQTVYMFVASLLVVVYMCLPIAQSGNGKDVLTCFSLTMEGVTSYFPYSAVAIVMLVAVCTAVGSIFAFSKRALQRKCNSIAVLLIAIGQAVGSVFAASDAAKGITNNYWTISLLLVAIILLFMANKAIKKDENLIKAADRIR